ncbi:hypothetical protein [Streptomyces antibioticus]|uniref:hypothetical protein n=1 Tax=Streptomyces antibioticus TaxID=1890 RepID=UPI0033F74F3A
MSAASPAEWAAAGFLGLSAISLIRLALALADADLAYFDPRPWLGRAGDRLLVEAVNVRYAPRDAAVWLAALLMILTAPEATR